MVCFYLQKYYNFKNVEITEGYRIKRKCYMLESRESRLFSQSTNSITYVLEKDSLIP